MSEIGVNFQPNKKKTLRLLLINTIPFNTRYPARTEIIELYGNYFPKSGHETFWVNPIHNKNGQQKKFKNIIIFTIPSWDRMRASTGSSKNAEI